VPDGTARDRGLEAVLAWTIAVAAVVDSALTYIGLRWLRTVEGSVVVDELIRSFGLALGLLVRTTVMLTLVGVLWWGVTVRGLRQFGLAVLALLNVGVIGWNLAVMW
jgi:hypothetical protein